MNPRLPDAVIEFGQAAEKALAAAGGTDLARAAEVDPGEREKAARAIESLGAPDLDPYSDLDSAAAAGELCRAAGRVALPYPLPATLVAAGGLPFALGAVPGGPAAGPPLGQARASTLVDHGDLFSQWTVVGVAPVAAGDVPAMASPTASRLATRLGPFATPMAVTSGGQPQAPARSHPAVDLHLVLTAWTVLGAIERAVELAVDHVNGRVQFGQTLASFQAVQFQLADAAVAVDGLRELCRFTLWRWWVASDACRPDSLALRLAALDAARGVMRTCQQLHGAAGVCDEYDISVLYRHLQPTLRLPFGAEQAADLLVGAVAAQGFDGLFPHVGLGAA